uniref:Cation efflux protein transmembrane domain-containing protein n=1 Tax=Haptolina ericina TaxID=156174 RepID=A0A7S3BAC4_9EUKA|mmetsp:Transcript_53149/g.119294  ORF Transcript_53149/g.119294 Transcript_53149/m.119294 type:complete len:326 (+) Transcript_53149:31-1008(+)
MLLPLSLLPALSSSFIANSVTSVPISVTSKPTAAMTATFLANPTFATAAGYICVGPACAPVGDFFDGPISARRKFRPGWAANRRLRRLRPGWAQLLAQTTRATLSNMSPAAITTVGAITNVLLAVFKLVVGSFANSASLIADGWHSFGDLISDVFCWIFHKIGARPPDARQPDGYAKFEVAGTLGIAGFLVASGVAMTVRSGAAALTALRAPALGAAHTFAVADLAALSVAIASVLSKELLFGATHAVGIRCRSPAIVANAYHHRSDALSSLVAVVGIIGAVSGASWVDPLAATLVGVMVAGMGREVAREMLSGDDEVHQSDLVG